MISPMCVLRKRAQSQAYHNAISFKEEPQNFNEVLPEYGLMVPDVEFEFSVRGSILSECRKSHDVDFG